MSEMLKESMNQTFDLYGLLDYINRWEFFPILYKKAWKIPNSGGWVMLPKCWENPQLDPYGRFVDIFPWL